MSGELRVDTVQNLATNISIPTGYFKRRILQRVTWQYRQGYWRAENAYYWVPGAYADFVPMRGDSRIKVSMSIHGRLYNYTHMISHWIFYRDRQEIGRHTRGGQHFERSDAMEYEIPSWGEGQSSRVGFMCRSYNANFHNIHIYHTENWDGGGTNITIPGQFRVEEFVDT